MRRRTFGALALTATAGTALPAAPAAAATGDAHLLVGTTANGLYHATRFADGSWSRAGNVLAVTGSSAVVTDVACVLVKGQLNVVVVSSGQLWHTVRRVTGSWARWRQIVTGTPLSGAQSVSVASVAGTLHVATATTAGALMHSVRAADGSWAPFVDLAATLPAGRPAADVALAGFGSGLLQLMTVSTAGALDHTVRRADGSWDRFRDVELQIGEIGTVRRVSVAPSAGGVLRVAAVASGRLWATVRQANGTWGRAARFSAFEVGAVNDVGVAATTDGRVQLTLTNASTAVLHTLSATGDYRDWGPVGDVRAVATELPPGAVVAMAGQ